MSAIALAPVPRSKLSPDGLLTRLRTAEPRFFAMTLLMLAMMAPTGFAAFADPRQFLGIDIWAKPLKFELALFVYFGTLTFFAMFLPEGTTARRWYRVFAGAVSAAAVLEIVWLCGAAMLGVASHFNHTPVGNTLYALAGMGATLIASATTVYASQIARNKASGLSPAVKESLVIGLALVLPLTLITAGTMSRLGSHFVGGTLSDAGGLRLMGWSRDGGDLRVAHFFSTHALHFIPAFGIVSAWLFGTENRLPVRLFALAFVVFVALLFVEALMGKPFLPWLG